ncbi:hypothetical protein [Portibacter lacus]|uniref:Uncharacterized protein n=1 Tax=Portibacter lacus TaxID=1099794 RepID=A0AA37WCU4_9BACT|nr:hypothetical protein [Portibacter lacus]GLR16258.1 hypothetical protein GCM10007940_08730 [Portibacter lacus]
MKILAASLFFVFSFAITECNQTPCYTDREVTKKIESVKLTCTSTGDLTLLEDKETGSRYSVCNASDYALKDSTEYIISGIVYKVKPNERWPGTPFEITKLKN